MGIGFTWVYSAKSGSHGAGERKTHRKHALNEKQWQYANTDASVHLLCQRSMCSSLADSASASGKQYGIELD